MRIDANEQQIEMLHQHPRRPRWSSDRYISIGEWIKYRYIRRADRANVAPASRRQFSID